MCYVLSAACYLHYPSRLDGWDPVGSTCSCRQVRTCAVPQHPTEGVAYRRGAAGARGAPYRGGGQADEHTSVVRLSGQVVRRVALVLFLANDRSDQIP